MMHGDRFVLGRSITGHIFQRNEPNPEDPVPICRPCRGRETTMGSQFRLELASAIQVDPMVLSDLEHALIQQTKSCIQPTRATTGQRHFASRTVMRRLPRQTCNTRCPNANKWAGMNSPDPSRVLNCINRSIKEILSVNDESSSTIAEHRKDWKLRELTETRGVT